MGNKYGSCMHVCTCDIYTGARVCVYLSLSLYIYIYTYTYIVHAYMHTCMYAHMHLCIRAVSCRVRPARQGLQAARVLRMPAATRRVWKAPARLHLLNRPSEDPSIHPWTAAPLDKLARDVQFYTRVYYDAGSFIGEQALDTLTCQCFVGQ